MSIYEVKKRMKKVYPGSSVSYLLKVVDKDEEPVSAETTTVKVYNPAGELVETPTVSVEDVGEYLFSFTLAANAPTGDWIIESVVVAGGYTDIEYHYFTVHPNPVGGA